MARTKASPARVAAHAVDAESSDEGGERSEHTAEAEQSTLLGMAADIDWEASIPDGTPAVPAAFAVALSASVQLDEDDVPATPAIPAAAAAPAAAPAAASGRGRGRGRGGGAAVRAASQPSDVPCRICCRTGLPGLSRSRGHFTCLPCHASETRMQTHAAEAGAEALEALSRMKKSKEIHRLEVLKHRRDDARSVEARGAGKASFLESLRTFQCLQFRDGVELLTLRECEERALLSGGSAETAALYFDRICANPDNNVFENDRGEKTCAKRAAPKVDWMRGQTWDRAVQQPRSEIQSKEEERRRYGQMIGLAKADVTASSSWEPFGARWLQAPGAVPVRAPGQEPAMPLALPSGEVDASQGSQEAPCSPSTRSGGSRKRHAESEPELLLRKQRYISLLVSAGSRVKAARAAFENAARHKDLQDVPESVTAQLDADGVRTSMHEWGEGTTSMVEELRNVAAPEADDLFAKAQEHLDMSGRLCEHSQAFVTASKHEVKAVQMERRKRTSQSHRDMKKQFHDIAAHLTCLDGALHTFVQQAIFQQKAPGVLTVAGKAQQADWAGVVRFSAGTQEVPHPFHAFVIEALGGSLADGRSRCCTHARQEANTVPIMLRVSWREPEDGSALPDAVAWASCAGSELGMTQGMLPAGMCRAAHHPWLLSFKMGSVADGPTQLPTVGLGILLICLHGGVWACTAPSEEVAAYVSSFVNQDGRSASLTAPNGPSQQACIRSSMRECNLQPDDIGFVENHGTGTALGDPIEVGSIRAVFGRRKGPPLPVTSGKTHVGHLEAGAGSVGLLKMIASLTHMADAPNCHLRNLNAHIETTGFPVQFPIELLDIGVKEAVCGLNSFGFGGTNSRAELWGRCLAGPRRQSHWSQHVDKLDFVTVPCARCLGAMCWLCGVSIPSRPGRGKHYCSAVREELASYDYCSNCFGGSYICGQASVEDAPDPGGRLFLTGTWSAWSTFEELEIGDGSTYVGRVVLGETLRERFRIVVEKDRRRAIYPVTARASQELRIIGPDSQNLGEDWIIDGRRDGVPAGTVYRVTFDWGSTSRSIRWEPMQKEAPPAGPCYEHSYWICGSLTSWRPREMKRHPDEPGTWDFTGPIPDKSGGASFAFLRDNDHTQTIYPVVSTSQDTSVPVMGPGDGAPLAQSFQHWSVEGGLGVFASVQLRVAEGACRVTASAGDRAEVVWNSPVDKQDRYYVVGSFNGWSFTEMEQVDATPVYRLHFAIGHKHSDQFQIVLNRNWETRLHPPHANATPGLGIVFGPGPQGNGLNWMVAGPSGQVMELMLDLTSEDP